jgi:hypothetical protein
MAEDPSSIQKADAAMREYIYTALWKDDVLRAMESDDIDVLVKEGIVSLNGQSRAQQARAGLKTPFEIWHLGIKNNLVLTTFSSRLPHRWDVEHITLQVSHARMGGT